MSKKFNLVYDNKGTIKGSYSGIPGDGDISLIEREVLEGSKPVPPTPAPTPADPTALVHAIVPLDFGEAVLRGGKTYGIKGIDAEALEELIGNTQDPMHPELLPAFRFTCDGVEYVITTYEAVADNEIGNFVEYYANDISGEPIEPAIFNYIGIETDTEDPQVILVKI